MSRKNNHVWTRCPTCKKKNKQRRTSCQYCGADLKKNKRGHPNPNPKKRGGIRRR